MATGFYFRQVPSTSSRFICTLTRLCSLPNHLDLAYYPIPITHGIAQWAIPTGIWSSTELGQSSCNARLPHEAAHSRFNVFKQNALRRTGPESSSKLQSSSITYYAL
eukprot:198523-Pelagomonas_calceolata.AAC.1